jgi:anhydro-N-acetylmuramic acid kinase
LDVQLGHVFARAAREVVRVAGVPPEAITGIGSHGQTVAHYPEPEVRASLQIGSAAVMHAETGWPVVSDFRSADLAAGGQGAPLTPFLHALRFASPHESRAILNIGGFSNVSFLPAGRSDAVIAFDPGPGNALIDRAAREASDGVERFDRGGVRAARGRVMESCVAAWSQDAYFARRPPKSTGHEYFDSAFFENARDRVLREGGNLDDLCASFVALTVDTVARAVDFFPCAPERWIVYGGGVHNPVLWARLTARLSPARVETTEDHGIPSDAVEALTFALLGWCAATGRPSNLPAATGARRAVSLGSVTPASAFRDARESAD